MATVNVTIRMDENLKKQADELFSDLGLSLSVAITMFAKQAVREQRILLKSHEIFLWHPIRQLLPFLKL